MAQRFFAAADALEGLVAEFGQMMAAQDRNWTPGEYVAYNRACDAIKRIKEAPNA